MSIRPRKLYVLRCRAVYGKATICFVSEAARDERASQLIHAGHAVVLAITHH